MRGSDTSVNSRGVLSHLKSLFFLFLFLICVSSQSLFSPFFFIYLIFFAKFVTSSKVHYRSGSQNLPVRSKTFEFYCLLLQKTS